YPHPAPHLNLHSFPTRRSSDLPPLAFSDRGCCPRPKPATARNWKLENPKSTNPKSQIQNPKWLQFSARPCRTTERHPQLGRMFLDRKSTRLNSSHEWISYAVFC